MGYLPREITFSFLIKFKIMKKLYFLLTLSVICISSFATIRTVSNVPTGVAQFNTIQEAIDASVSGDSVYVSGSPNTYSAFTINGKKIAVFGVGWSPDKQLSLVTYVNGCALAGSSAAGSELHGIVFVSTININDIGINDLKFIRNRFYHLTISITPSTGGNISNYLFEGNWFDNSNVNSSTSYSLSNFLFHNNIFYESGCCVNGNISGFTNIVNVLFDHNLWYGPSGATRDCFSGNCRFLTISNNIFVERNAANQNSLSTFNNNITFQTGADTAWAFNSNVDGGGNKPAKDPKMAAQTNVNSGENNPLLDFTISTGPANNAASDGKDMGLLYDAIGSLNWLNSRASRLPFIYSMNVTTPVVTPGGTVTVSVEARKNN